jgi:hypothetical protein
MANNLSSADERPDKLFLSLLQLERSTHKVAWERNLSGQSDQFRYAFR